MFARSFQAVPLVESRFHVMVHEEKAWEIAMRLHGWMMGLADQTATLEDAERNGFTLDDLALLASKGGLRRARRNVDELEIVRGDEIDEKYVTIDRAMRQGELRRVEWKCVWQEEDEHEHDSDLISRVIADESGRLSGTTRLVQGPHYRVVEIHFGDMGDRPWISAYYEPTNLDAVRA